MKDEFSGLQTVEQFLSRFTQFSKEENALFEKAYAWFCDKAAQSSENASDSDFLFHPLRVAAILANSSMDSECVAAALLHSATQLENVTLEEIDSCFGSVIQALVNGSTRITNLKMQNKTLQQADSIRKMLFAMVDDIRVILIRLADRLDRLRNLKETPPETQKLICQEVLDVWAPLANRLGMSSVKDELEDLALKYTNPDVYEQIKQMVQLKKNGRAEYLEKAQKEILKAAAKAGFEVAITSRAKHFYSIYQKMRKRGKAADEIYDLLALRIICKTDAECYTLIGLVHGLWKPLEGRFKDYIAMPKANGYQSLHTTVLCDGMPLEIQIRTEAMHSVAEHGVASHWLYKKGSSRDAVSLENLTIINQLKKLRAEQGNDAELFNEIREELLGDSIFVFTPKGDVRELPIGATAVDFAYSIHSHIGETIVGAKADGHIIPLSSPLKNTQIIEILTNPQTHPTENQLEYVKTARARSKIKAWLLQHVPEQMPAAEQSKPQSLPPQQTSDPHYGGSEEQTQEPVKIRIGDTTNFLVKAAGCCHPVYGDPIIGYVSRGRGLIIHRENCPEFARIYHVQERTVSVVWEEKPAISVQLKKQRK